MLGYRAESLRKVTRLHLCVCASDDWKTFRQPSSKWVPFLNQGRIRQRKERDELHHSRYTGLTPIAPMAIGYGKLLPFRTFLFLLI